MTTEGTHSETNRPARAELSRVEERIANLVGKIRAIKLRNPAWDTSKLERELKRLKESGEYSK